MNRHDRRAARTALRARADQAAPLLARFCLDLGHGCQGPARAIGRPLAVKALERAFRHMLRQGGTPHVLRITAEEAQALAPWEPVAPPGWSHFMAVGLDRLGRASYVSRPVRVEGASAMEARRLIEAHLLADLRPLLDDTRPLPMPAAAR